VVLGSTPANFDKWAVLRKNTIDFAKENIMFLYLYEIDDDLNLGE
jgi:hypothetical protein